MFELLLSGNPVPTITVAKDNKVLDNAVVTINNDVATVVIPALAESESGSYTVTATNDAGVTSKQVKVKVAAK